jgi:tetratricopeptide (TPR) repeat protein
MRGRNDTQRTLRATMETREMERRLPQWPRALAVTLLAGAIGTVQGAAQEQPASANGAKYKVLVPSLERAPDARGNFGRDVAEELRKLIAKMPRHEPIERREMQEAMRKFRLQEDSMTCIPNMQLATHMQAELVVCGRFTGSSGSFRLDSVQVVSTKTQEAFRLQQIMAATAKEAAAQIFAQFDRYVSTLENAAFCYDYLASQQWPQAIENCNKALEVNPNSVRATTGKAFALYSQAVANEPPDQTKLNEAYALYKKALEIATVPDQDALRMAGIIAARLSLNEESRSHFRQYLDLNPGDAQVRLTIANEQSKAGDKEGALRIVEEGLKTDSANLDLLTWAGVFAAQAAYQLSETKKGENNTLAPEVKVLYETAAGYYRRLYDTRNGDVEAAIPPQMMQTYFLLERDSDVIDLGGRLRTNPKFKTGSLLNILAQSQARAGSTADALATLDEAITLNDTTVKGLRFSKGNIQLRAGDLPGAVASFQAAAAAGEAQADQMSNLIFATGYTAKVNQPTKDYEGFLPYIDAAREVAQSESEKSKLSYWAGVSNQMIGRAVAGAEPTLATARAALPYFQRAIRFMEGAALYSRENSVNLGLDALRKYYEYLDARVKAGR